MRFEEVGIEVELKHPNDFLKVKETLTRIGIASSKEKKLFQSCHILHKQGKYRILHFKELFLLDKKTANLTQEDLDARNTIVKFFLTWGLFTLVDPNIDFSHTANVRVISFKEKNEWQLVPKYTVGKYKNTNGTVAYNEVPNYTE